MHRGLKRFGILFTCLSVVMFSSIFVMADENDNDINMPEEVDHLVDDEEVIDEPLSIDLNKKCEDSDDSVEIIIEEDTIVDAQEELEEVNDEDFSLPQVISIDIDCRKGIILDRDVVFSPCNGRSANTTGIYQKKLSGIDAITYDILKDRITDVAYGRLTSTEFEISLDDLGFDNVYTAEELGIDYVFDPDTQKAYPNLGNIMLDRVTCNLTDVLYRFIFDCPFEMYWYDKTQMTGCYFTEGGIDLVFNPSTGEYEAVYDGNIAYYFPVSNDYATSMFVVNGAEVNRALRAFNYAKEIVEQNKNSSDLEKLNNYLQAVVSLTNYNEAAARGGVPFGDPWQWVYVFDRNTTTNVVCEGYSKAFKLLCDLSDFESEDFYCILVTGLFTGIGYTEPHMWNVVSFGDGMNYLVDVTNCDTGTIGYLYNLFLQNYDYQNGDSNIITGDGWTATYSYYAETKNLYKPSALVITPTALIESPVFNSVSNCGGVTLSWTEVSGAIRYEIFRRPESGPWSYVGYTQDLSYTDTNVNPGVYFYCVRCKDVYGNYMNILESFSYITHKFINHTYVSEPDVLPDCTHTGLVGGVHCSVCGAVIAPQHTVPAWGHIEIIDDAVPATTTHTGLTEGSHCARCGEVLKEQEIIPIIIPDITISLQPDDFTGPIGAVATFSVEAEGEGVSYQWQYLDGDNWVNTTQSTAHSSTLNLTIVKSRDGWKYRCIVTDASGASVTSDVATLHVHQPKPLAIIEQPTDYTGPVKTTASFSVKAEGEGVSYQWQYLDGDNWVNTTQSTARSSTLNLTIVKSRDGWKYRCIVTDPSGASVTSDVATLHVYQPKPLAILEQPTDYTGLVKTTASFSVKAEGEGVAYQWQYLDGDNWVNTTQSTAHSSTLNLTIVKLRDGWKYRCIVTDASGASVTSDIATLHVYQPKPLAIIEQPTDYTGPVKTTASFSVKAEGEGVSYQWQYLDGDNWVNTTQSTAHSSTLNLTIVKSRDGWKYRCIVTDASGASITSEVATLHVYQPKPLAIIEQPTDYTGPVKTTASFSVKAEGEGVSYQWQYLDGDNWVNTTQSTAHSSTLNLTIVKSRDGWKYRCIVTDVNHKSVISNEVTLHVF